MRYEVVVLGGGPAGVTAALRARELGATVALVERGRLGGTCTNDGCVPTRVLAKAARLLRDARQFEHYGLRLDAQPRVDMVEVLKRAQQVVYQVHEKKQLINHLTSVGIKAFSDVGAAQFVDPHRILTENNTEIEGEKFIICVGGAPRRLPFPGADLTLTHSDVWGMDTVPESVAIVGGGATGCQLASILEAFGSRVTLMDIAPRILITEDEDVSAEMTARMTENGITLMTGIGGLQRVEQNGNTLDLIYVQNDAEHTLNVEVVILAVGWPGNVDGLGLDAAGVETNRSYIAVNDHLQTSVPHIYAAGDITGRMMLVQSAGSQARVAAENAVLGEKRPAQHKLVPHGGFTDPEYGSVGLTESQARQSHEVAVAKVPYADLDRAVIDGRPVGFCKLIIDRKDLSILGAHVVGEQAVEVVQMVSAGMAGNLNVIQLANLELAYPTFAAVVGLAARQIVRQVGAVPLVPEWRELAEVRAAEWERMEL